MATSDRTNPDDQALVPDGGDYGSRQANVAAMQAGGVPTAPVNVNQGPAMPLLPPTGAEGDRPARTDFDILEEADPSDFASLLGAAGDLSTRVDGAGLGAPVNPSEILAQRAATSNSALMRLVAARLAEVLRG